MKSRGEACRGIGLVTTLGFTGAIVLLAFVCVAACFAQLTISTRGQRMAEAELTADAVAQLAGARLLTDPAFGNHGAAVDKTLEITLPQGSARLTFDADQALRWGIPVSRNNLAGLDSLPGYARTLPAYSVQLLAQGQSGGRTRLLEVILNQPPFKWAIASTGQVHSTGGLQVLGVKDFGTLINGIENLPPEQILPGHLVSDSSDGQALHLDSSVSAPTLVTGDAQSMGGVNLGASTTVRGQVKQHAESAKLPEVVVENYDPAGVAGVQTISQSTLSSTLNVSGISRRTGSLTVNQGGLALDEGYLYVDGDLEIYGGLSGKGAIFSTGDVKVHGLSQFATSNLQAIVAKGNLELDGSGPGASSFQGLLMSGGGQLKARQVTLVGSFVGTSRNGQGSNIDLDQVKLVASPQAIHLDFPNLLMQPQHTKHVQVMLPGHGLQTHDVTPILDPHLDISRFYDPVADRLDPALVTSTSLKPQYRVYDGSVAKDEGVAAMLTGFYTTADDGPLSIDPNVSTSHPQMLDSGAVSASLIASYKEALIKADAIYQQARQRGLPKGHFSLDPNTFLQSSDKLRRLLWRVVE